MSKLLEIFGRAIRFDTAELIWTSLAEAEQAGGRDEPKTKQLRAIAYLLDAKKLDTAQGQLREYLSNNPSCIYGRLASAAICISKGRLEDAIEELEAVYRRQPNNTLALYAMGHCCERLGEDSKAVEFYQDCLKFRDFLPFPRERLAAIYFKNGQIEKTISEYELLRDNYPDDMSTLVSLGYLYIATRDYDKAIDVLNTAILIQPDSFEEEQVEHLLNEGLVEQALGRVESLSEQWPGRADLAVKRADILNALGAESRAVNYYQQALNIFPDYLEAAIKLGTQYLSLGWERLAGKQFSGAAEINDRIVEVYIALASAQKLRGKLSGAQTSLSLAAAIEPNSSVLISEMAGLQFKSQTKLEGEQISSVDTEKIISFIISSGVEQLHERPNNPDLQYTVGLFLMSIGKMGEAAGFLKRSLELNKMNTRARNKLSLCLFETGKKKEALDNLICPDCLDPETLELHYRTALLYCDKVRFASSLLNLESNLRDNYAHSDASINVSVVLQNLGVLDRGEFLLESLAEVAEKSAKV